VKRSLVDPSTGRVRTDNSVVCRQVCALVCAVLIISCFIGAGLWFENRDLRSDVAGLKGKVAGLKATLQADRQDAKRCEGALDTLSRNFDATSKRLDACTEACIVLKTQRDLDAWSIK
jgi:hypothetical protein